MIRLFSIPDPHLFHLGSRIRIKEFKYFIQKTVSKLWKYDPGCSSWILIFFPTLDLESRGEKGDPGSGPATPVPFLPCDKNNVFLYFLNFCFVFFYRLHSSCFPYGFFIACFDVITDPFIVVSKRFHVCFLDVSLCSPAWDFCLFCCHHKTIPRCFVVVRTHGTFCYSMGIPQFSSMFF